MKIIRIGADRHEEALLFYEEQGYKGGIRPSDLIVAAIEQNKIIGLVRIALEEGVEVLRGMFIHPDFQRKGLGKKMLEVLTASFEKELSYCLPFEHLVSFYQHAGFEEIKEENAPVFLQERLKKYREEGVSGIIMRRTNKKGEAS